MYSILTWTRQPTRSQIRMLKGWLARHHGNLSVQEIGGPAAPASRYLGWIEGPEEFANICFLNDVRAIRKKGCEILRMSPRQHREEDFALMSAVGRSMQQTSVTHNKAIDHEDRPRICRTSTAHL